MSFWSEWRIDDDARELGPREQLAVIREQVGPSSFDAAVLRRGVRILRSDSSTSRETEGEPAPDYE